MRKRNESIDIFRYVCAIMVVAIHTRPLEELGEEWGYLTTQILPQIGVPFFFAVAGYFYASKLEKGEKSLGVYMRRLLRTYLLWSCLYYLIDFAQWGHSQLKGFIVNCVYSFVVVGSHYHFWFFPALIFSAGVTTALFRWKKAIILGSVILYTVGCLGTSYYQIGIKIPVLERLFLYPQFIVLRRFLMLGFPCFIIGYVVLNVQKKLEKTTHKMKYVYVGWGCSFAVWAMEICLISTMEWQNSMVMTFGLYFLTAETLLLLCYDPLSPILVEKMPDCCRCLANFTYYSHPLVMTCLQSLIGFSIGKELAQTPLFVATVVTTFLGGFAVYRWDNKQFNWLI